MQVRVFRRSFTPRRQRVWAEGEADGMNLLVHEDLITEEGAHEFGIWLTANLACWPPTGFDSPDQAHQIERIEVAAVPFLPCNVRIWANAHDPAVGIIWIHDSLVRRQGATELSEFFTANLPIWRTMIESLANPEQDAG